MRKAVILAACLMLAAMPCTACGSGGSSEPGVVQQAKGELSQAECDDLAKRLFTAANSTLTDLAADGIDLSPLNGDFTADGGSIASAVRPENPAGQDELRQTLFAGMRGCDADLAKADFQMLAVRIKDGVCTAFAAQFGAEAPYVFGTYPKRMAENSGGQPDSISGALQYAAA